MEDYGYECGKDCLLCRCCADYDDLINSVALHEKQGSSQPCFSRKARQA